MRGGEGAGLVLPRGEGGVVGLPVAGRSGVGCRGCRGEALGHPACRRRAGQEQMPSHERGEGRVHAVHGIAHAHGRGGVPVVAAADREESAAAGPAARRLVLEGELERDLHRDRAGVGEEHVLERGGGVRDEPFRQVDGGRVREPAEHDVREGRGLPGQGLDERGVPVPVHHGPPGRHRVDGAVTLPARPLEVEADAPGTAHGVELAGAGGPVGVPEVGGVAVEEAGFSGGGHGAFRRWRARPRPRPGGAARASRCPRCPCRGGRPLRPRPPQ